jgi:nitrite reductase/ring-hydroxylating ferredoxin subunit
MYKQVFDLRDGRCLDDVTAGVPAYPVTVVDGMVMVDV